MPHSTRHYLFYRPDFGQIRENGLPMPQNHFANLTVIAYKEGRLRYHSNH